MSDLNFDANFDEVVSFTADFGVIGSTSITVDQEVTETSSNPVASSGIYSFTTEKVGEVASAKEDKAFVCTYGTTSYADVLAAYNAGKQLILLVGVDKYYLTKVTQTNGIYAFEFSSYDSNLGLDSVRLTKTETGFSWDSDNHDSIYATKTSVNTSLATKQNTLVSGTNIKTINGQSVLGEGNLVIEGGSGGNVDDVTVNGVSVLGSDKVARVSIPTNVSSFTNDAGYITESSIPTVPTKTSDLTNDSGFITSSDIPSIPSKTSDLTNDSGFITAAYVPTKTSQLTNDSDYTTTEQVAGQLDLKQDKLTAGTNITISEDNVISATGGSGGSTVTMADNAQGGVDLTVDGTSKTLAKQTSVTDLNNALNTLSGSTVKKVNGVTPNASGEVIIPNVSGAIDDNNVSLSTTYSSSKIQGTLTEFQEACKIVDDYVALDGTNVTNQYINGRGEIGSGGTTRYHTFTTDVTVGTEYYITASTNYNNPYYAWYDDSMTLVLLGDRHSGSAVGSITRQKVTCPTGATKLVLNWYDTGSLGVVETLEGYRQIGKWGDKKWACIGDSLTASYLYTDIHYFEYVAKDTDIEFVNYGENGSGYAKKDTSNLAFYQRVLNMDDDFDVVTIFGSFNDLGYKEIGTYTDTGTDTLAGCINTTIDNIISIMPTVNLGIVSPCPWSTTRPNFNENGNSYKYVNMIKTICEYRSIPYLDLWHNSNLRPWDSDFRALAYSKDGEGGSGGTHPNEIGHKLLAPHFKAFLETLLI